MRATNVVLRFVLQLIALAAVFTFGFHLAEPLPLRIVLGLAAAVALDLVWGVSASHNATNRLSQDQRLVVGTVLLEVAAAALAIAGQPLFAIAYGIVVLINGAGLVVAGADNLPSLRSIASGQAFQDTPHERRSGGT